jgi:hypothetical protein
MGANSGGRGDFSISYKEMAKRIDLIIGSVNMPLFQKHVIRCFVFISLNR